MVATSLWRRSKKFKRCDPLERYLFLYLITNEDTELCGAYEVDLDDVAHFTGIDYRTLPQMMQHLSEIGLAYYVDGWVLIPNYVELQNIDNHKVRIGVERGLAALPDHIREAMDRLSIGYAEPSDDFDSDSDSDSDYNGGAPAPPKRKRGGLADTTIEIDGDVLPINKNRYERICREYGKSTVHSIMQRIINYEAGKAKQLYQEYSATAENWIKDDVAKGRIQPKQRTGPGYVGEVEDLVGQIKRGGAA